MLAFATMLITAGSLGDLLGRRRVFMGGIALFGLASLAAGVAQGPTELIAARVVQGAAAAAMIPQVLATFRVIFSGEERGQGFGAYGAILGFASAIGLVLGGALTGADLFGWGWRTIFLINVPVAAAALVAAARLVPETREPGARRPDVAGAVLLTGALVAVVYPLLEGRGLGWPAWTWALVAAGVAALAGLGALEARRRDPRVAPLLRPGLFRIPAFSAGLAAQLAFSAGLQGFFVAFAIWLQTGRGFSPLAAGLTALAFSAGSFALAPFSATLAERHGRRVLSAGGVMLALGVGAVGLGVHHVGTGGDPWPIVPGLVLAGAGLSLLIIPLVNVVLAAVPREAAGGASGQFTTAQQLGGAIGVAVIGTVFFSQLDGHGFTGAFAHTLPLAAGLFLLAAVLVLALPRTAVAEGDVL
jgi:MFS family permease